VTGSFRHRFFDFQEQLFHVLRPGLLILVDDELQFSQVVGIAQSMFAVAVCEVRTPMVMDSSTLKLRQDADGLQRLPTPLGMNGQVGQQWCAAHMHPLQSSCHPHS